MPLRSTTTPAKSIERDVIEISDSPPQTKRPHVILRLHPRTEKAKPKIILRVKKLEAKSSVKQLKKGIFKRDAEGHNEPKRRQKKPRRQTSRPLNHGKAAAELQATISRRTRTARAIKPTKKAAEAENR
ncbi:MAG: hypothetical protein LQ340_003474 [Diploschistes diacapsis]|nr:MAG: hypothetical protein LQ340_003474 [Diploschistes diacapsis]